MTLDAAWSILDVLCNSRTVSGFQEMFFLFAVALAAILSDGSTVELAAGNLRRNNIVCSVTILTHGTLVASSSNDRLMERMFRNIFGMARLTLDRLDPFFMRKVVRIESCMAGGTGEFFMGRSSKVLVVHEKGNSLPFFLHSEGIVRVTRETLIIGL